MTDILELFGVSSEDLSSQHLDRPDYPDLVLGRVLNIDADFLAYQVTADDSQPFREMQHNLDVAVETLRLLAGAEKTVLHLTDIDSCKGGRYRFAVQKEYQANRHDKVKPEALYGIKNWMVAERGARNYTDQEADDGLCQANCNDIENAVLVSKDKDLWMCPGTHMDWDTGVISRYDEFGFIDLDRSKSTPKIRGRGTKYFWSQMLTGDAADNIQGVPKLPGSLLNVYKPTKVVLEAKELLLNKSATPAAIKKAESVLANRKPGGAGPVLVHAVLQGCTTDKQCFEVIKSVYKRHGETIGYTHWETGEVVRWQDVMLSEARLLWMRRVNCPDDVVKFLYGIGK